MTDAAAPPSRHAEIAKDVLHGRVAAGGPVVSPDGQRIAFVVGTTDLEENTAISRIWLAGPDHNPAPLTAGPHDGNPVWSPDGRFLAFGGRRGDKGSGKDKESTLCVLPVDGPGETRTVVSMPDGVGEVTWSPDGRWIAFTSRTQHERYRAKDERWQSPRKIETFFTRLNGEGWVFDRPEHVYVVAADGTDKPRNLTPGRAAHTGIGWLPDSSGLVMAGARHETWDRDLAEDLFVVTLDGDIRALTHQTGVYALPAVSPDGSRVAFVGADDPNTYPQNMRVGVIPIAGGDHEWISTGLDRTFVPTAGARAPVWQDDATLLATAEDRGETHLYRLAADGTTPPERLTTGPITVAGFDAAGGRIAMAQSTVEHPSEIVTLDGPVTQLTKHWLGWERFAVPTTDGIDEIDAWLMRPTGFDPRRKYALLLNVHGGPFTQYGETFFDEAQFQAAAGFVVLMCNPRGGSGRDTAWGQAILGPKHPVAPGTGWGTVDVDDVMAVLDAALARFRFLDADRVGMLGGSYGGFMATTLATRHSDRFRGILSERAVNNLLSEEWSSDIGTAFRIEHGPDHVNDPDEYRRMSPISHVHDIDVPMLLIHSDDDLRCPISQAEELFMALRILDKPVDFYRFPAETHELSRSGSPVHRQMRAEIILDWFAEHTTPRRKPAKKAAPKPPAPRSQVEKSGRRAVPRRR